MTTCDVEPDLPVTATRSEDVTVDTGEKVDVGLAALPSAATWEPPVERGGGQFRLWPRRREDRKADQSQRHPGTVGRVCVRIGWLAWG